MSLDTGTLELQLREHEDFAPAASSRLADALNGSLCHWSGRTGRRYAHTVYSLIACPPVDACSYMLVKRQPDGVRQVLRIASVGSASATLNLADIRQRAARLGANEVHVLQAGDPAGRMAAERDLRTAQFAELSAEPSPKPASWQLC